MNNKLIWNIRGRMLVLQGNLNRDTLLSIWKRRKTFFNEIYFLDVSNLKRIDSSGVALILHFYHHQKKNGNILFLIGVNRNLYAFLKLYKLKSILPCTLSFNNNSNISC